MAASLPFELDGVMPTTYDRIRALCEQEEVLGHMSQQPQTGIHKRFDFEWAMVVAYVEGEVHERSDAAKKFVRDASKSVATDTNEEGLGQEFQKVTKALVEVLLLHSMCPALPLTPMNVFLTSMVGKVVRGWKAMALAPPPSKRSIDEWRVLSTSNNEKSRAANGDLLASYGARGEPVPDHLATIFDEDFDPITEFIADWLMNPFLELVTAPFRSILPKIPIVGKRFQTRDPSRESVDASTMAALAKALLVIVAILCLTAAIFTLEEVKRLKVRILVVALYALVFALPVQYLGPHTLAHGTLICT